MGNGMEGIKFDIKKAAEAVQKELNNESTQNLFKKQEESVFQEENEINSTDFKTRLTEDFGFKEETADAIWEFLNIDTDEDSEDKLDTEEIDFWMQQIGQDLDDKEGNDTITLGDITYAAGIGLDDEPDYIDLQNAVKNYLNLDQTQTDTPTGDRLKDAGVNGSQVENKVSVSEDGTYTFELTKWDNNPSSLNCESRIMGNIYGVNWRENKGCYTTLLKLNGYSGTTTPNKGTVQIYSLEDLREATAELAAGASIEEVGNRYSPLKQQKEELAYSIDENGIYNFDLTIMSEQAARDILHAIESGEITIQDEETVKNALSELGSKAQTTEKINEVKLMYILRGQGVSEEDITTILPSMCNLDEETAREIIYRNSQTDMPTTVDFSDKAGALSEAIGNGVGKNGLQTIDNMPEFPDCDKVSTKAVLQAAYHLFGDNRLGEMLQGDYSKEALNSAKSPITENREYTIGDVVFAGSDGTLPGIVIGVNEDGTLQVVQGGLNGNGVRNGIFEKTIEASAISGIIPLGSQAKQSTETIQIINEELARIQAEEQERIQAEEQKTIKNLEEKIQILGYDSKIQEYDLNNITGITTVRLETGEIFEISGEENAENISGYIDEQTSIEIVSDGKINNANKKAYEYIQQLLDKGYEISCETNDKEVKITTTLNGQEITYTYTPTENNDGFTFISEQNGQKAISAFDLDGKLKEQTIILKNDENDGTESESKITYAYNENGEETITSYENLSFEKFKSLDNTGAAELIQQQLGSEELSDAKFNYDGEKISVESEDYTYVFEKDNTMHQYDADGNKILTQTPEGTEISYKKDGSIRNILNATKNSFEQYCPTETLAMIKNMLPDDVLNNATFDYYDGNVTIVSDGSKYVFDENVMYQYDPEGKPIFVKSQDTQGTQYNLYGIAFELDENGGIPMDKFMEIERKAASMGYEIESISSIPEKGEIHIEYFGEQASSQDKPETENLYEASKIITALAEANANYQNNKAAFDEAISALDTTGTEITLDELKSLIEDTGLVLEQITEDLYRIQLEDNVSIEYSNGIMTFGRG